MSELSGMALIFGGALGLLYAPFVFYPAAMLRFLRGFHRNVWAGRVLAAVDLLWAGWLLRAMPLPWLEPYKTWLIPLVPVVFALTVWLLNDLLAARALGGLLLLAPSPLLAAAFLHPSPWRLVVVVLAYVMAVKGIFLVLSPYLFRKAVARWATSSGICRKAGGLGLALGLFIVYLGLRVY